MLQGYGDIMIRFANENDIENIKGLWDICFPEEPDFNKYFFANIFDVNKALIYEKENKLISMIQMLPYEIKGIGKVTYIYGAATSPQYRNKGYMRELLEGSYRIDKKHKRKASILIPANKELFDFYKKLGYENAFYIGEGVYTRNGDEGDISEVKYKDISKLMNLYTGDIVRKRSYWKMYIDMYNALGGKIFIRKDAYAVVTDRVEEIMYSTDEGKNKLLNAVCSYLGKDTVDVVEKGYEPFGMIKKYKEIDTDNMYMNLMLN